MYRLVNASVRVLQITPAGAGFADYPNVRVISTTAPPEIGSGAQFFSDRPEITVGDDLEIEWAHGWAGWTITAVRRNGQTIWEPRS